MRKSIPAILLTLIVAASTATAQATPYQEPAGLQPGNSTWVQEWDDWVDQFGAAFASWIDGLLGITTTGGGSGSGAVAAPEFDPAGAAAALTLLSGGLVVLRGRRSKRK
jgi:hypothetical protein